MATNILKHCERQETETAKAGGAARRIPGIHPALNKPEKTYKRR